RRNSGDSGPEGPRYMHQAHYMHQGSRDTHQGPHDTHPLSRDSLYSLGQLTLARVREFTREPEAVFWAVFFPILLTAALGIAFGRGSVDVVPVVTSSAEVARALEAEPGLSVHLMDESAAQKM